MKKAIAIFLTASFFYGTGTVPAVAQNLKEKCTAELKKVEREIANFSGDGPLLEVIEGLLERSKEARANKKNKKCIILIKRARERMG